LAAPFSTWISAFKFSFRCQANLDSRLKFIHEVVEFQPLSGGISNGIQKNLQRDCHPKGFVRPKQKPGKPFTACRV